MNDRAPEVGTVTQEEWAEALGCSTRTVRSMLANGRLPSMPMGVGNRRRTTREQFRAYFAGDFRPTPSTPVSLVHTTKRRKAA